MLLDEADEVPLATLVVAEEPGAVRIGDADACWLLLLPVLGVAVEAASSAVVVVPADCCAAANGSSSRHSADETRLWICIVKNVVVVYD